ncbi:MAG: T9SS C-terminal target domain-containing protein [Saprospirales bacterium]|nr:MAG: T9SS C-terminal target domain-containing protein [Saprospirales bacterium]
MNTLFYQVAIFCLFTSLGVIVWFLPHPLCANPFEMELHKLHLNVESATVCEIGSSAGEILNHRFYARELRKGGESNQHFELKTMDRDFQVFSGFTSSKTRASDMFISSLLNEFEADNSEVFRNTNLASINKPQRHEQDDLDCPEVKEGEFLITSDTVFSGVKTMSGTVVVETGNRLTVTGTMRMLPGTSIYVERGSVLEIRGGLLTKRCNEMWNGIQVQGNSEKEQPEYPYDSLEVDDAGVVLIRENGTIEWAVDAIKTLDDRFLWPENREYYGGVVDCENGIFQNNRRGVAFMQYDFPNKSNFLLSFFYGNPEIPSRVGVTIWRCSDINFQQCHFEDFSETGISGINFHSWIYNNNFFANIPEAIKSQATFPFGSHLKVGTYKSQHHPNVFENNQYSIVANGTDFGKSLEIVNNIITKTDHYNFSQSFNAGIRISGPSIFEVTNNFIQEQSIGVWIQNTGMYGTGLRCNFLASTRSDSRVNYGILAQLENRYFQFKYNSFDMNVNGPDVKFFGTPTYSDVCRFDIGAAGDPARNCFTFNGNPQIVTEGTTRTFRYWIPTETHAICQIPGDHLSDMGENNYNTRDTRILADIYCGEFSVPLNLDSAYYATLEELKSLGWKFGLNSPDSRMLDLLEDKHLYRKHLIHQWWNSGNQSQIEALLKKDHSLIGRRNLLGFYLKTGNYTKAEQQMKSLSLESEDDQAFYYIQNIVLEYMRDTLPTELTSSQRSELISIAVNEELPSSVYARALFNKLDPSSGPFFPAEPGGFSNRQKREAPENTFEAKHNRPGFSLSPVPTSDEVTVTWETDVVVEGYSIYDIHGQQLQSRELGLSSGSRLDISDLPAGMYIIALKLEDGSIDTQKFIVQ